MSESAIKEHIKKDPFIKMGDLVDNYILREFEQVGNNDIQELQKKYIYVCK